MLTLVPIVFKFEPGNLFIRDVMVGKKFLSFVLPSPITQVIDSGKLSFPLRFALIGSRHT